MQATMLATSTSSTSDDSGYQYPNYPRIIRRNPQRKQYEEDLKRRQEEHLRRVADHQDLDWQPCMHEQCPSCHGTGIKVNGSSCLHMIACPCSKCSPRM